MKESLYVVNGAAELYDLEGKPIGLDPMVSVSSIVSLLEQNKTKGGVYKVLEVFKEQQEKQTPLTVKKVILQAFNSQNGAHSLDLSQQLRAYKIIKDLYSEGVTLSLTQEDVDFILDCASKVHGLIITGTLHDLITNSVQQ